MREVEDDLVIGICMNGGHEATLDAKGVQQDLGHRRNTVSSTRGIGDDGVLSGIVEVIVDAHDDRDVFVGRRGRNDDLLGASSKVSLGLFGVSEDTGGLNDDIRA